MYSQLHLSFVLLNKSWSDMGAGSSCLLSNKAGNFPMGTHSGWSRAVTQGLNPSPILQHQKTVLGVMLETGNQQVAPWPGSYPRAGVQLGTGRPLGELPFPSTPVWDWHFSLFTVPILFSPLSKCLAQCPVLPGRADA